MLEIRFIDVFFWIPHKKIRKNTLKFTQIREIHKIQQDMQNTVKYIKIHEIREIHWNTLGNLKYTNKLNTGILEIH